jgi:hypothetical protein
MQYQLEKISEGQYIFDLGVASFLQCWILCSAVLLVAVTVLWRSKLKGAAGDLKHFLKFA